MRREKEREREKNEKKMIFIQNSVIGMALECAISLMVRKDTAAVGVSPGNLRQIQNIHYSLLANYLRYRMRYHPSCTYPCKNLKQLCHFGHENVALKLLFHYCKNTKRPKSWSNLSCISII